MQPPTQDEATTGKRNEWALTEFLKRGILAGIGALFMTEEGARSIIGEMKLPKEAAQFVINQAAKTKEELFRMIANEVRSFLESTNLAEEVRRALSTTSLQISTTVRFIAEEDQPLRPSVKTRVKTEKTSGKKRGKRKKDQSD